MAPLKLHPGDHICYPMKEFGGLTWHHGIYCGSCRIKGYSLDNIVIHYDGKRGDKRIKDIYLSDFAKGNKLRIKSYRKDICFYPQTVVKNAISRLGESGYDLFGNNCEHFATWCKTGCVRSQQIENANPIKIVKSIFGIKEATHRQIYD